MPNKLIFTAVCLLSFAYQTRILADTLVAGYSPQKQFLIDQSGQGNPTVIVGSDPEDYLSKQPQQVDFNVMSASPLLRSIISDVITGSLSTLEYLVKLGFTKDNSAISYTNNQDLLRFAVCIPGSDTAMTDDARKIISTKCQTKYSNLYNLNLTHTYYDNTKINTKQSPYNNDANQQNSNGVVLNTAFNAETLMTPLVYLTSQGHSQRLPALDFIRYASGTATPFTMKKETADFITKLYSGNNSSDDKATLGQFLDNPENLAYFVKLRSYAASVSAGMHSLMAIYAQRLPTIAIDKDANKYKNSGLTLQNGKTSPRALEAYMATRRIRNKDWIEAIEKSPPVNLQREMVYAQADQLYETYLLRQSIERLEATMAVMQLSLQGQTREKLNAGN